MTRGLWHYLKNMPPIDVDAIAQQYEERFTFGKKGPQPIEWTIKRRASRVAREQAKALAAAERSLRRQQAERKARKQPNLDARLLAAMEPGRWYGRPDIRDLSGAKRNSVHARLARFERDGWVERAENPDWTPTAYPKGTQINFQARGRPPKYLFRLTKRGEQERRSVAFLA